MPPQFEEDAVDSSQFLENLTLANFGLVFQLAILEGLLSFDNALALAALVSNRLKNPIDRRHALLWGIWGAYITRIGVVFIGVWLMANPWIKFVAGAYLLWLAASELLFKKKEEAEAEAAAEANYDNTVGTHATPLQEAPRAHWTTVWKTILAVELMDVMFSIDSIAVALAVSDEKWVLIAGAILGILMMRVSASVFIKLIVKWPVLVPAAFLLVGIAGLKVILEIPALPFGSTVIPLAGIHVPESFFLPVMLGILGGAIALNVIYPDKFRSSH